RNAQGLVFGPDGKLYADEHGPKSDDEVNIIWAGKNYGWPHVAGKNDDQAYAYGNWSASSPTPCASLTYSDYTIPLSVPTYTESSWKNPVFWAPIKTLFTVQNGYNFQDPACAGNYFLCWPTVAPSSLDIYAKTTGGIPGWANSLLVISLKTGGMYKLKLSADGNSTVGDVEGYWFTQNRYRDVALNPDGVTFYVSTDNSGATSGPTTGWTTTLINPGAILEFQYTGVVPDPVVPPPVLFRSAANSLVGQHDTTTITKPVGVVNGDILLAHIYAESDGHAITAPSGWTLIVNVENVPSDFRSAWYWKRATGEGSNYVFTSTGSIWLGGAIAAYSGAIASGNPIDAFGSGNVGGSNTSAVATSITTTVANTLVVFGSHQFHLPPTLTPP
ncbi:MAG: PQQ-dependent sugar dehydrogenase, partial [Bacteroidota bacterium]